MDLRDRRREELTQVEVVPILTICHTLVNVTPEPLRESRFELGW